MSTRREDDGSSARLAADHAFYKACSECASAIAALFKLRGAHFPEIPWVDEWPDESKLEKAAPAIARKLIDLPEKRRRVYLRSSNRTRSRPVVEALIEESKAHLSTDDDRAVEIATLAQICTDEMSTDRYEEPLWFDLKAVALANLSNAHRRSGDLRAAGEAIEEALIALLLGTENPSVVASVLQRKSRLDRDLGDFEAALAAIEQAVELCQFEELRHQRGVVLYERSRVLSSLERHEDCLADLHSAINYLDLQKDGRMGLVVFHAIAIRCTAMGRLAQASHYLDEALRLWTDFMNAGDRIRIAWARARLEVAREDLNAAGAYFLEVRDRFLAMDYPLDASLATLEFATILAEQGRFDEVAKLASEMKSTFQAVGVPRQALAAAYLLREAENVETVQQVAATLIRLTSSTSSLASIR